MSDRASETGAPKGLSRLAIAWAVRIEKTLDILLGLMLLALALSLFYQVFGRYVIGKAPGWTEEVARMLAGLEESASALEHASELLAMRGEG